MVKASRSGRRRGGEDRGSSEGIASEFFFPQSFSIFLVHFLYFGGFASRCCTFLMFSFFACEGMSGTLVVDVNYGTLHPPPVCMLVLSLISSSLAHSLFKPPFFNPTQGAGDLAQAERALESGMALSAATHESGSLYAYLFCCGEVHVVCVRSVLFD